MGAEPLAITAGDVPDTIDAGAPDDLLAFSQHLDRTATAWLDGLGAGARRNGRRVFYLVVGTQDYALGIAALVRSLRARSTLPILVLAAGGWKPRVREERLAVIHVPEIVKRDLEACGAPRFRRTLTKLWAFSFVSADRLVFLDGDCIVEAPVDDLLDGAGFAAAPDLLCNQPAPVFNSGVFALSPDAATRQALFETLPGIPSFDGGDQGILNAFIGAPAIWLPSRDNYLRTYEHIMPGAARTARIVHFTAKKPWHADTETEGDRTLIALDDAWTEHLDRDELMALVGEWRRRTAATEIATNAALARLEAEITGQRNQIRRLCRNGLALVGLVALLQLALFVAWLLAA
jgi:glycogenin glucosyltransferase